MITRLSGVRNVSSLSFPTLTINIIYGDGKGGTLEKTLSIQNGQVKGISKNKSKFT